MLALKRKSQAGPVISWRMPRLRIPPGLSKNSPSFPIYRAAASATARLNTGRPFSGSGGSGEKYLYGMVTYRSEVWILAIYGAGRPFSILTSIPLVRRFPAPSKNSPFCPVSLAAAQVVVSLKTGRLSLINTIPGDVPSSCPACPFSHGAGFSAIVRRRVIARSRYHLAFSRSSVPFLC